MFSQNKITGNDWNDLREPGLLLGGMVMLAVVMSLAHGSEPKAAFSGQPDDSLGSPPAEYFRGTWAVVASQVGNHHVSLDELERYRVSITRDKLIYRFGNTKDEIREGLIQWDPATKGLDWNIPALGVASQAIYDMRGDTLKIGFGNFGADGLTRPTHWEIDEQEIAWLLVLRRGSGQPADIEEVVGSAAER